MLLELQRGNGAAREIVAQAAILHSRPVTRHNTVQNYIRSTSSNQLLDGLRSVINSRARDCNVVGNVFIGNEDVAFVTHRRIEVDMAAGENIRSLLRIQAKKHDPDLAHLAGERVDAAFLESNNQVLSSEVVFRILAFGQDSDALRQRNISDFADFSRHGNQG